MIGFGDCQSISSVFNSHLFLFSPCGKRSPQPGMNRGSLRNHSKASTMKLNKTSISAYLHTLTYTNAAKCIHNDHFSCDGH